MAYTNIDDPSAYFQTALILVQVQTKLLPMMVTLIYNLTLLWIKRRNAGYGHVLVDSNRGLGSSNPPYLAS